MAFRISRRSLVAGSAAAGVLAGSARFPAVYAQDSTPEAETSVVPELPEIVVTVNDASYSVTLPVPVLEGQFLLTVNNTTDSLAVANVARVPEEVNFGDFTSALFTSFQGSGGELPEFWGDVVFAGGSWAGPGATSQTIVNLVGGTWTVFSTNPASAQSAQNFTVLDEEGAIAAGYLAPPEDAGTPGASPEAEPVLEFPVLAAEGQIDISDSALSVTGGASGEALWSVTNSGSVAGDVIVYQVAEGTDAAGAAELAATVAAGGAADGATLFASLGLLSPGATGYIVGHLAPGTYAAFSTAPAASGALQASEGVAAVVVVE